MSKTVDERVVSMQFDNRHFENNVQTSMGTLEKLKRSLNFSGASKSLDGINSAVKKCDMGPLASGVETVHMKFSALQIMATTALANITNSAVNAGKRMAAAFTIEPIKTGFSEYETKLNSVQTILANTKRHGTTLEDVNKTLDELNTYADETIYNFAEMTRSIGMFTTAGIDLETSSNSIKGIANLAAFVGAPAEDATRAMYQLSQALSTGEVRLTDWMSLEHTAGMAGKEFQDRLIDTARVFGTGVDAAMKKNGSFRESLRDGWLTTEVLTATLSQFAGEVDAATLAQQGFSEKQIKSILELGESAKNAATNVKTFTQLMSTLKESAQSGWAQTWELLIGDFEEAKELWTSVSDVFGGILESSAKARNEMLQGWSDLGGRKVAIEAIKNAFQGLMNIVKPIKEAFREIFPRTTSEQLFKITESIRDVTEKFRAFTEKHAPQIKAAFKGIFSVIDIGVTIIKSVVGGVFKIVGSLLGFSGNILDVAAALGNWISKIRDSIKESDLFGRAIDKIISILQAVIGKIKEFTSAITGAFDAPGLEWFLNLMHKVWDIFSAIGRKAIEFGSSVGKALGSAFRNGDFASALDILNGGIIASILLNIRSFTSNISKAFKEVGGMLKGVTEILDSVRGCLEAYQQNIRANTLLKIAAAVAILAASLLLIAAIDPEKLIFALGGITVLFYNLTAAMSRFTSLKGTMRGAITAPILMIGMATAILILASALKKISDLDIKELATGLAGVAGLTAIVVLAAKALSTQSRKIMTGATSMVIFAAAVKILASVCKDLASLSWEELGKGLTGVAALMASIALFMNFSKFSMRSLVTAIGIVALSGAIKILASACKDFSTMSWEELGKGLAGIGVLLAELAIFTKVSGSAKHMIATGTSLILIGTAMRIFADSIKGLGSMKWKSLAKGLGAFAASLAIVTLALRLMPKSTILIGAGLTVVASALLILAEVIKRMGGMSWESVAKSLVALGGALGILAIGLHAMKGTLVASAAVLVAATALSVLTPILKTLGGMSWKSIAKGLLAIAGAFTIFGLAALVLKPLIPTLLALSGAIALFGIGCAAVGVGVFALSAALTALATAGTAGATAIVAAITIILTGLIDLIPTLIERIGQGFILLCEVIAGSAESIGKAVKAIVLTVVDVLVSCVPAIAEGALKLIVGVLDALVRYTPQIVDLIFDFLVDLLEGVAKNIPRLVDAAVDVIMTFFTSIFDALAGQDWSVLGKALAGIGIVTAMLIALSTMSAFVPGALVGVLGVGAVLAELAGVLALLGMIQQIPGLSWLINEGGEFLQSIGNALGKMVGGLVGGFLEGTADSLPEIAESLSEFMQNLQPFLAGAENITPESMEGVQALAGVILTLTATSVLDGLTRWLTGGSSLVRFAEEIVPFGEGLKKYSQAVAGIDPDVVKDSAVAAEALSTLARNLPNSGGLLGLLAGNNDIGEFGIQLIPFGEGMKKYSQAVSGIDADVIKESAVAGEALAKLADILPNSGGLLGLLIGSSNLGNFAEQLVPFGEGMKDYADAVDGIDADVVTESATAANALVSLADALPKTGGLMSWLTGESNLGEFGKQLVPFAEGMRDYSLAIDGMNTDAVKESMVAAEALAALAENLPNSGGLVSWFTGDNSLGEFASYLKPFGEGMKDYSDAISGIDAGVVTESITAAKALAELASNLPNSGGLVSWFTGDNSLASFGDELIEFGKGMKGYSDAISGINSEAVNASANAASALAALADNLPNEGGALSWIVGDNKLSDFANHLEPFGKAMKAFSDEIVGVDPEVVTASANAAKALSEVAKNIPNEGGLLSWLSGDNKLSDFANHLEPFGKAMKAYSDQVKDIKPEAVESSANAAKAFSELAKNLADCGDLKIEDITKFAEQLAPFGEAMKGYADGLGDKFDSKKVEASANAAKALAELVNNLPGSDGIITKFTGIKSLSDFGDEIVAFGADMRAYSDSLGENFSSKNVTASANAGKTLAELANNLPSDGSGLSNFINGKYTLTEFASQLKPFGEAMAAYSTALGEGFNADTVTKSASAATAIAELAKNLPTDTGFFSFMSSDGGALVDFANQLEPFGDAMAAYSTALGEGFNADTVTKSASAAKTLADVVNILQGCNLGILSNMFGEDGVTVFAGQLKTLGDGMKAYATAVAGVADKEADVTVSASVAKTLADVASTLSGMMGLMGTFADAETVSTFASQMVAFGDGMKSYATSVAGIADKAGDITASAQAAKDMVSVAKSISGSVGIIPADFNASEFANKLKAFADGMKTYSTAVAGIDSGAIESSASAARKLVTAVNSMSGIDTSGVGPFVTAINDLGTAKVAEFVKAFKGAESDMKSAGSGLIKALTSGINSEKESVTTAADGIVNAITKAFSSKSADFEEAGSTSMSKFISGVSEKKDKIGSTFESAINSALKTIRGFYSEFSSAGGYLVDGFAAGISANSYKAAAKARAMAAAAESAAKAELDEHSPSKKFYKIGAFAGIAFVNALGDYRDKAYNASSDMASYARRGLSDAISRVNDFLSSDMDTQPTIRPVLDLSDVTAGASRIGGLFDNPSIGVMSNVRAIGSMAGNRQNGANNDDVISAIKDLGSKLGATGGDTYNVGDITYDDGSNVSYAVKTLVRAARVEGRR